MSYVRKATYEETERWKNSSVLLQHLTVELTERCNYSCVHCSVRLPRNDAKAKYTELSVQRIGSLLKEAVVLGCQNVTLSGGEPLIRNDFSTIYRLVCKHGIQPTVLSNGSYITDELAGMISTLTPQGECGFECLWSFR